MLILENISKYSIIKPKIKIKEKSFRFLKIDSTKIVQTEKIDPNENNGNKIIIIAKSIWLFKVTYPCKLLNHINAIKIVNKTSDIYGLNSTVLYKSGKLV